MTTQEKLDMIRAYPKCWAACLYVEEILCVPPGDGDDEPCWDYMMRKLPDYTPSQVSQLIRDEFEPILSSPEAPMSSDFSELARRHMDHPDFVKYLAGKMGAV